jgi:hypothetical protein
LTTWRSAEIGPEIARINDPSSSDFGARRFDSAPGLDNAHSAYWNDENPVRESMGMIMIGVADCGFRDGDRTESDGCEVFWR